MQPPIPSLLPPPAAQFLFACARSCVKPLSGGAVRENLGKTLLGLVPVSCRDALLSKSVGRLPLCWTLLCQGEEFLPVLILYAFSIDVPNGLKRPGSSFYQAESSSLRMYLLGSGPPGGSPGKCMGQAIPLLHTRAGDIVGSFQCRQCSGQGQ